MNIKLIVAAIAVGALGFTSCDKEPVSRTTTQVTTYNYVTLLTDDDSDPQLADYPVIKKGYYSFMFDYISNNVTIASDLVDLGNDNYIQFATTPFKFTTSVVNFNGGVGTVYYGSSLTPGTATTGEELKNLRFELSPLYYIPPVTEYDPDPTSPLPQPDLTYRERTTGRIGEAPKMVYTVNDKYMVYTFWPDLYYNGVTRTSVNGNQDTAFESQEVGYRIKFDVIKKKALVVMYNVQFNPNMPKMECLILPDLDVDFTNNGFVVEARNVVPLYIEGRKIMANPQFPFTKFKFTAEGNMVEGNCEFTVQSRFQGNFVGKYMEFVVR